MPLLLVATGGIVFSTGHDSMTKFRIVAPPRASLRVSGLSALVLAGAQEPSHPQDAVT